MLTRAEAKLEWLRLQIQYQSEVRPPPDLYAKLAELNHIARRKG